MSHPYRHLPDHAFWRRAVADLPREAVDPIVAPRFRMDRHTPVMTAGSCFAQHIGRWLRGSGLHFLDTEPPHPLFADDAQALGYGVYSARYGNVYTSRQLVQLFDRAFGHFVPEEPVWEAEGAFLDPFRPTIQEGGFASAQELEDDREQHLAAVRKAFQTCGVLVFTLGLTESWRSRHDGAVFPVCPGVSGGTFDPERHGFWAMGVEDVVQDLDGMVDRLRGVNPEARMLLTVSPVPLVASAAGGHVLAATTLSKAILRTACDMIERRHVHVAYVPAYEIVTGAFNRGAYFAEDLRSVTEAGVAHVMGCTLRHYFGVEPREGDVAQRPSPEVAQAMAEAAAAVAVMCDEEALDGPVNPRSDRPHKG